ncbi:hypothetical protein [Streptomyces sp. HB2AG]|uniref:hypothetical protein n=1 Tax=Streptomyces sp. HB2AG TaxID=2983400 RepID=UPI0022AB2915|nr:hypothetical protein [Streptomyces sp. HB2AG]MCZ2527099.1 hypothetical protein [Streptomyces sp. HB2AG]
MERTGRAPARSGGRTRPIDVYLNDHLAGATGGVGLARRIAGAQQGSPAGPTLRELAREVARDRDSLLEVMAQLGVEPRRYKVLAAWAGEKAARLKSNGRLVRRSPLSTLVELEAMHLGVEGKASLWRALRALADRDPRLSASALDALLERARRQAETLEELRLRQAVAVLTARRT